MQTRHPRVFTPQVPVTTSSLSFHLPLRLAVALACIYSGTVHALPQNPSVLSGAVTMSTDGQAMQISQSTDKAIIDWQKFGTAYNESITFNQPSRSSVVLNRVTGTEFSTLDGALSATGQVFIINPNGVLISPTARINVGGLLASTLGIENQRFLNSEYTFTAKSASDRMPVTNAGTITAVDGGYIVMLANNVRNSGTIDAASGHVLMGAGSQATLYISDQSLLAYRIDTGIAAAFVENGGNIRANGGQVTLAARGLTGASELASAAVNNSGIIEAKTLNGQSGAIVLSGDRQTGRVSITGKLDASAQTGKGGTIDTSAAVVTVGSDASVSTSAVSGETGLWTVKSGNPVIGPGQDSISNIALNGALSKSNATIIAGEGDMAKGGVLSVNGGIDSQGKNRLMLTADHDLLISAPVAVGSGGLVAFAGNNGAGKGQVLVAPGVRISASDGAAIDIYTNVSAYTDNSGYNGFITSPYRLWMLINDVQQLQRMQTNLSGNYALSTNIDAADTASWNGGAGFTPIGYSFGREFKGMLDGRNQVISGLVINRPGQRYVGLFGMSEGEVKNLGMVDVNIIGALDVGTFAGMNAGKLDKVYATGEIQATIGGGLVGVNTTGPNGTGSIRNAYTTVNLRGEGQLSGIAGFNAGTISDVYATGKISPVPAPNPDINTTVWGPSGAIAGYNYYGGVISNAYWTTDGTGQSGIAGLDHGKVNAASLSGGLTTETLKTAPLDLNFDTAWFRYDGRTAPLLKSFLKPLSASVLSRHIDKVYDGMGIDLQPQIVYSKPDAASSQHLFSTANTGMHEDASNVGSYKNTSPIEFWSDQRGYLIEKPVVNQNTTLSVSARPITVEASPDTKFFDSSNASLSSPVVSSADTVLNMGLANGDSLKATQSFDSIAVGDRSLIISSLEIKNSAGKDVTSNYQVTKSSTGGKILDEKVETAPPTPTPTPTPGPVSGSGSGPDDVAGGTPSNDKPGDSGQGGRPSGPAMPGAIPPDAAGGSDGEIPFSPGNSIAEQQRRIGLLAFLGVQDEDEMMKRSLRNKKLRSAYSLMIRDGGIKVPREIIR